MLQNYRVNVYRLKCPELMYEQICFLMMLHVDNDELMADADPADALMLLML